MYWSSNICWTLNIQLNTFSAGGCRQWCFVSLESFGSSNIILPSPSRSYQRWSVYIMPSSSRNISQKKNLDWLFIYLDDYRPLICASDRLLQTTSQICGSIYFSDLWGHYYFFNIWIVHNYSFTQLLSFKGVWFCEFFSLVFPPHSKKNKKNLYTNSNFQNSP